MDLLYHSPHIIEAMRVQNNGRLIQDLIAHVSYQSRLPSLGQNTGNKIYRLGSIEYRDQLVELAFRVPVMFFRRNEVAYQFASAQDHMRDIESFGLMNVLKECEQKKLKNIITTSVGIVVSFNTFLERDGIKLDIPIEGYGLIVEDLTCGEKISYDMAQDGNTGIPIGFSTKVQFDLGDHENRIDERIFCHPNLLELRK